jgi:cold shock CspA family protein
MGLDAARESGEIGPWFAKKRFGFARVLNEEDVFVHTRDCRPNVQLSMGVRVSFLRVATPRGDRAVDVAVAE